MNKKLRNKITVFMALVSLLKNSCFASEGVSNNNNDCKALVSGIAVSKSGDKVSQDKKEVLTKGEIAAKCAILFSVWVGPPLLIFGVPTYAILNSIVNKKEENRKKLEEVDTEKLRCLVDKFLGLKEWKVLENADNLCCNRVHAFIYARKNIKELGPKCIIPSFLKFGNESVGGLDKQSDFHFNRVRHVWKTFRKSFKVENTVYDYRGYAEMKLNFSTLDGDMCIVIVYDHKNKIPISLSLIVTGVNNNHGVCCNSVECQWTWIYNKAK